jgi:hypothetical protein
MQFHQACSGHRTHCLLLPGHYGNHSSGNIAWPAAPDAAQGPSACVVFADCQPAAQESELLPCPFCGAQTSA